MCKCCQNCLESCYWTCCEQWFCYDESIALWEDPEGDDRGQTGCDNMAYWDSIAVIANRSVVTIQPQATESKISLTPQSIIYDDYTDHLSVQDDLHRRLSEVFKNSSMLKDFSPPKISSTAIDDEKKSIHNEITDYVEQIDISKNTISNKISSESYDETDNVLSDADKVSIKDTVIKESESLPALSVSNLQSVIFDTISTASTASEKQDDEQNVGDKKETNEKPASSKIDENNPPINKFMAHLTKKPTELRLIKQNSMPNFYIDTPDISESPPVPSRKILMSPVLPNTPTFTYDLRSIVELETNKQQLASSGSMSETGDKAAPRLVHLRKKLAPLIIKKPSLKNIVTRHHSDVFDRKRNFKEKE